MQDEINYIILNTTGRKDIIPVHTLYFSDYQSFLKMNPVNFLDRIKDEIIDIKGSMASSNMDIAFHKICLINI